MRGGAPSAAARTGRERARAAPSPLCAPPCEARSARCARPRRRRRPRRRAGVGRRWCPRRVPGSTCAGTSPRARGNGSAGADCGCTPARPVHAGKVRCRAGGASAKGRRAMIGVDSLGAVALPVRRGRAVSSVICTRIGARASSRSSAPPFLADVERLAESLGSVRRTFGPCVPGPPPSGGEKTVIVCAGERGCACVSGWRVR